jgi:hypothetical protein
MSEEVYNPAESAILKAVVEDNLTVTSVSIFFRGKSMQSYIERRMQHLENNIYSCTISPDVHRGREIRYFLTAKDGNGNQGIAGSEKKPFKIKGKDKGIAVPQIP